MRLFLLISFALMVVGCGGSGDSSDSTKNSSTTSTVENPNGGSTTEKQSNGNVVPVVNPDGSTIETTTYPDGKINVIIRPVDGSGELPVMKFNENAWNKSRLG